MTAPTFVQAKSDLVVAGTSLSVTLDADPTPGNLLVATVTTTVALTSPVYPWGGTPDLSTSGTPTAHTIHRIAQASESRTITVTSAAGRNMSLTVQEFATPAGMTWALDKVIQGTVTPTVTSLAVGPTATLSDPDDVAIGVFALSGTNGTSTPTMSGFTVTGGLNTAARGFTGYRIPVSTTALSTTGAWTTSVSANGAIVTYKQVALPPAAGNVGFLAIL